MSITVLLVDDHALVREGLRSLLQAHQGIDVIGEAGSGDEAILKNRETRPDVIVMDISMMPMGGIEATRRILAEHPKAKIIGLSRYEDLSYARSLLKAGASGYVTKRSVSSELVSAIRAVHAGDMYLQPSIASQIAGDYVQMIRSAGEPEPGDRLTERERQIVKLLAEGLSSRQIADELFVSVKTVLNHRENIMGKLGLRNLAQLIKYAVSAGLAENGPD